MPQQERLPRQLRDPLRRVGIELHVADRPVEQLRARVQIVGLLARAQLEMSRSHAASNRLKPSYDENWHLLVQGPDHGQVGQRAGSVATSGSSFQSAGGAGLPPLIQPVDDLPEHFRLGPGGQQRIGVALELRRSCPCARWR